jgi:hypothetical protein
MEKNTNKPTLSELQQSGAVFPAAEAKKSDAPVYRFSVVPPGNPQNVVILSYNYVGKLVTITFSHDCTDAFIHTAKNEAPVKIIPRTNGQLPKQFDAWLNVNCHIKDISNFDLSFEKFWTTYNNKVGNIARVKKKWNSMPAIDRIMALGFVGRMRNYYDRQGIMFPYPETYLNQRRWENIINQ